MTILYRAPAGRARRHAAIAVAALSIGVASAWLFRLDAPVRPATQPAAAFPPGNVGDARTAAAIDARCDARCAAAKVIMPASAACAAAIEELAGFGVRWLDADAASPKFDRFAWLQAARGSVTLGGGRAEFRNAAGEYRPVDYDCDFDPATLAVLEARARPRGR